MSAISQPILLGSRYTLFANFQGVSEELQQLGLRLTKDSPRIGTLSWDSYDLDVLLPIAAFCVRSGLVYGQDWFIAFAGVIQPFSPVDNLVVVA